MNVKKKFLIGYAAAAVIALLAFEYAFWSNGFSYLEKQSEAGYLTQAEMLRDILLAELQGDADLAASSEAFAGRYGEKYQIRITIIDKDGNVLGESDGPGPAMSNHLDREEVRKALAGESNSMIRRSATFGLDYCYCAVPLKKGEFQGVIRTAVPMEELRNMDDEFLRSTVFAAAILLLLALSLVMYFRKYVSAMKAVEKQRREFVSNVTHELKTPLTTIQGYAQLIEADQGNDEELIEKGVGHILHESTRLHRMVIQLLEMADRAKREEKAQIDMGNLLRSVSEAMEIKANRYGAYIRLKLEQNLYVWGQEERLRQVFINLIDNAVKYGEEGTEIRISGGHRKGRMLFSVSNKGKPMSQEELKHIFEPFYRADKEFSREQGSAGLGLSICQKIIREHKGAIWAENRPGERIGFFLLFPELEGQNPGKETYEGQNL